MPKHDIKSTFDLFSKSLADHRIAKAISELRTMAGTINAPWPTLRDIDSVAESYNYLRQYALDAVEDPHREEILADIESRLSIIATGMMRSEEMVDSPRQYFNIARFEALQPDSSIGEIIKKYANASAAYISASILGKGDNSLTDLRRRMDQLAVRAFNIIWTTYPLSSEDRSEIEAALTDNGLPSDFKALIISALTLGSLEYFDWRKIVILASTYLDAEPLLEIRALVGLMMNLWIHRQAGTNQKVREAIAAVVEKNGWREDLRMVFLELVKTRDTERISHKLSDEVIPEMMKMRPDILNKIGKETADDEESLTMSIEENPEWMEMLEKSGIADKLKELNDLQAEGADVMMSTFGRLKNFSFFNEVANWFLPFTLEHSEIRKIVDETANDIGQLISTSPMMCDSDKYSIILSLERIPPENRRMMLSQFKLQDINISELQSAELNPELNSRKNKCNKYIHDLYRFFNLYRRKSDFNNPFSRPINLASVPILKNQIEDADALGAVGEFYFKRGYYNESLDIFSILVDRDPSNANLLQKCGYCCQQTNQTEKAIKFYQRSEFIRPDSLWTLRRLAQCYKSVGKVEKALDYYQKVSESNPDDIKLAMLIGNCHLESGNFADALKSYHKVEFLSSSPAKAYRPIAWASFLSGDYDKSLTYYAKVLDQSPSWQDYMNLGHLQAAMGKYRDAVDSYQKASQLKPGSDSIINDILSDRSYLDKAGVSPTMFNILIDSIE